MNTNRALRWLVFGILLCSLSAASFGQIAVGLSVRFGPPAIPVYTQPICPGPGYLFTPGYWSWNDDGGYYWVPGTWVVAPVGLLWTPGYWGWGGGFYRWHAGYWGPHVGFYGGINYGFGYTGAGFFGGEWRGGAFFYNRAVMNVNVSRVTNVYERTVVVNHSRVAFNGGEGGINARATAEEERYEREPHREAVADQIQHEREASRNKELVASANHGRPAIAATGRPGEFNGRDVIRAKEAGEPYRAPKMSPKEAREASVENHGAGRAERNMEHDREVKTEQREKENREVVRNNNSREQARQEKADMRNDRQQAKQEQKHQQQEKQQAKKTERKQAQQDQKKKRQEEKQGHEERGPGR